MTHKIDFPAMVPEGENPNGVRTEGAFGVSHGGIGADFYQQPNYARDIAGPRWGGPSENMLPGGFPLLSADTTGGSENSGKKLKGGR